MGLKSHIEFLLDHARFLPSPGRFAREIESYNTMKPFSSALQIPRRSALFALAATIFLAGLTNSSLRAADVTWNNGDGTFLWNTTDMNWDAGTWNNANGDGAIFGT